MRVLITRAPTDAERSARQLAALGHKPVVAPLFELLPTDEPAPPGRFDGIVLTSARAVPALATLGDDARTVPVFAVGERTASAAATTGIKDVRTAGGDARSLAALVIGTLPPGARLLHIAGRHHKPEPVASLVAAGFDVQQWTAYEARAREYLPEVARMALDDGRLDAILHYSRRSAAVLLDRVAEAGLTARFLGIRHVCLSPDAAMPLRAAGATNVTVAEQPDEAALFAALQAGVTNSPSRC